MAQAFTSYVVSNDIEFRAAVKSAVASVKDLSLPFNEILKDFYRSEQAIFALKSEGAYPEISDKYGKRKFRRYGFIYPLLLATGPLAASVLSSSASGSVAKITPTRLTFGTTIKYGIYHQSDQPRTKIPLRKFLFIGPESTFANSDQAGRLQRWTGYLSDYVAAKTRIAGVAH